MQLGNGEQHDEQVIPFIGLRNMGNTCYLNSILQILYYCPSFEKRLSQALTILENERKKSQNGDVDTWNVEDENLTLIKELQTLFSNLNRNRMRLLKEGSDLDEDDVKLLSAVRPESFINSLRKLYPVFEPFTQQDAQECFHCILSLCKAAISLLRGTDKKSPNEAINNTSRKVVGGRKFQLAGILGSSENKKNSSPSGQVLKNKNADKVANLEKSRVVLKRKHKKAEQVDEAGHDENGTLSSKSLDHRSSLADQTTTAGCFEKLKQKHSKLNEPKSKPENSGYFNTESSTTDARVNKENNHKYDATDIDQEPPTKKSRFNCEVKISSKAIKQLPTKSLLRGFLNKKRYNPLKVKKIHSNLSETSGGYESHRDLPLASTKESTGCNARVKSEESAKLNDFIQDTFQGELVTTTRCMECESKVHRSEMFQDISLPVKDTQVSEDRERNNATVFEDLEQDIAKEEDHGCHDHVERPELCNLSWALSKFTSSETLDGENKYFCNVCLRLSEGERSTLFKQLPPILTFHLKRFSTTSTNFTTSVSKITSAFKIPSTMKFAEWCSDDCSEKSLTYELFGVVLHSGTTITSGHYLSYVKYNSVKKPESDELSKYDGQWLEVDDEQVRVLSKQEIDNALEQDDFDLASRSPYMLFYRQL